LVYRKNCRDLSDIIMAIDTNKSFNMPGLHCSNVVISNDSSYFCLLVKNLSMQMINPFTVGAGYNEVNMTLQDGTIHDPEAGAVSSKRVFHPLKHGRNLFMKEKV